MTEPKQGERERVRGLIERIVAECPRRIAGSASELRAQEIMREVLEDVGASCCSESFRVNRSLYESSALHFGVGLAGSALFGTAPAASLLLHLVAGLSYVGDATKSFTLLRAVLPQYTSQNLIATFAAKGPVRKRIVLMAHIDAAFTGLVFHPTVTRFQGRHPARGILGKPLRLAALSQFALAGLDVAGLALGRARGLLWPVVGVLSLPGLLAFLAHAEVALRNEVVAGANDNLTGCAALTVLASRLASSKPDDVELVLVITGAEEAGMCGALALARADTGWDRGRTVLLGVDTLSGGQLRYFEEGEVKRFHIAPWLENVLREVASSEPRFQGVGPFAISVGGTDVVPFLARGFDAVSIGCVDEELGAPRNYHLPSDVPENVDYDQVMEGIEYIEGVVRALMRKGQQI